jgi:hypothetical protein
MDYDWVKKSGVPIIRAAEVEFDPNVQLKLIEKSINDAVDGVMGAFCRGLLFVGVTEEQIQQAALKAAEFKDE